MSHPPLAADIALSDGQAAVIRPLRAEDVEALTAFFLGLSEKSRSTYEPHPFDRQTAERLCASIDNDVTIRFLCVLRDGAPDMEIVGYMILSRDISAKDQARLGDRLDRSVSACLAPVIADTYQSQSLGTRMARHVLDSARAIGLRQVVLMGGVLADNPRARRLYERMGFRYVGEFWTEQPIRRLNYDMILDLQADAQQLPAKGE